MKNRDDNTADTICCAFKVKSTKTDLSKLALWNMGGIKMNHTFFIFLYSIYFNIYYFPSLL